MVTVCWTLSAKKLYDERIGGGRGSNINNRVRRGKAPCAAYGSLAYEMTGPQGERVRVENENNDGKRTQSSRSIREGCTSKKVLWNLHGVTFRRGWVAMHFGSSKSDELV